MQEVGLDALEEAGRASSLAMEIDWHSKPIFEEKFEIHETGESGRHAEIDEEIEIMCLSFTPCGGSKQPMFLHPECGEFGGEVLN